MSAQNPDGGNICGPPKHSWCLLTSASRRGVPGIEPCVEFARVMGGVRMRRPNLSNLAGEAVREMIEEADPIRWWCRWPGRTGAKSMDLVEGSEVGPGAAAIERGLLAFTKAIAACASCCCIELDKELAWLAEAQA